MTAKPSPQDREYDELVRAFRKVMSLASGKRVLFWLLEQSAVYQDAYHGDAAPTNYTLGRQSVGRRVIAMLDDIDPRLYPGLLLEVADMKVADQMAQERQAKEETEDGA